MPDERRCDIPSERLGSIRRFAMFRTSVLRLSTVFSVVALALAISCGGALGGNICVDEKGKALEGTRAELAAAFRGGIGIPEPTTTSEDYCLVFIKGPPLSIEHQFTFLEPPEFTSTSDILSLFNNDAIHEGVICFSSDPNSNFCKISAANSDIRERLDASRGETLNIGFGFAVSAESDCEGSSPACRPLKLPGECFSDTFTIFKIKPGQQPAVHSDEQCVVSEPTSLLVFGSAIIGFAVFRRLRQFV
jgi:hypothetical protein